MQTVTNNQGNVQSILGELQSSLDAYLNRNLEFSELRTRWITELAERPEMRNGALRLLYQQPFDRNLTEVQALSLKRIVETAIHDVHEDWTVALDEDGDALLPIAVVRENVLPVKPVPKPASRSTVARDQPKPAKPVAKSPATAAKVDVIAALAPGRTLGNRFILEELLGQGGIGAVYRALDRFRESANDGSAHIALKVLREEFRSNTELRNGLRREALQGQALSHPNIVRIHDFHQDGQDCFLTMELLEGELLQVLMSRRLPEAMSSQQSRRIVTGMCSGLAYAHAKGVVHADIKPGNVFLANGDEPKILDFGFAASGTYKSSAADGGKSLRTITPAYASCNRLEGGAPAFSDDVYSLSCVIYELLAGNHPYDRKTALVARELKLQPKRIEELTDIQWRTLATGLSPSRQGKNIQVRDLLDVFDEKAPLQPVSTPAVGEPLVREVIVKRPSMTAFVFGTVVGIFFAAAIVAGMVALGVPPVPSKFADTLRQTALVQSLQSTFDIRPTEVEAPVVIAAAEVSVVASNTESLEGLPEAKIDSGTARQDALNTEGQAATSSESAGPSIVDSDKPDIDLLLPIMSDADLPPTPIVGPPAILLGRAVYFVDEDSAALAVQIHRRGDLSAAASVEWSTVAGSADPQIDYASSGREIVQFAAGEDQQLILVPIVSDTIVEADESFRIVLLSPGGQAVLGEPNSATVTILDDDS